MISQTLRKKATTTIIVAISIVAFSYFLSIYVFKPSFAENVKNRVDQLSSLDPASLEALTNELAQITLESKVDQRFKAFGRMGTLKLPPAFEELSPVTIYSKEREAKAMLEQSDSESLWLTASTRGNTRYLVIHHYDSEQLHGYRYIKREVFPINRMNDLVEQVSPYNSGQSLRD